MASLRKPGSKQADPNAGELCIVIYGLTTSNVMLPIKVTDDGSGFGVLAVS